MVEERREDEVETHRKFAFFLLCVAQHIFTVFANFTQATTSQVMFAFASMNKGLIVNAHALK